MPLSILGEAMRPCGQQKKQGAQAPCEFAFRLGLLDALAVQSQIQAFALLFLGHT